jgi:hypothetical protein
MIVKTLAAIMAAILVVASAVGSFYFAGAQEQSQAIQGQAKIALGKDNAQAGSAVDVSGSNFSANSDVSIYFMSAARADLTNHSALILQEIAANNNQSQTASTIDNGSGDIFGNALNTLRGILGLEHNNSSNGTNAAINDGNARGHLLAVLDTKLANGTVSLKCDDQNIAQGSVNDTSIVNLAAEPGTYSNCSIAVADGNATDNGDIGSLTIAADPDKGYENSKISSVKADAQGSFAESVTVPKARTGEFAILAADSGGSAAVSELSVTAQSSTAETVSNATSTNATNAANATTGETTANDKITNETTNLTSTRPLPNATTIQNQTGNNQTNASGKASVQVDEKSAEPGSPLTVTGEGFKPNAPVMVFINSIQITNVITNIEGSFNTVIIVPTTVNAGSANVVVKTEQTNISENVNIVEPVEQNKGPATMRFTAVSATDRAQTLKAAPVTVFDTSSGRVVDSGKTPINVELEAGTYSVFYSDFKSFDFTSAEPGKWTDTPNGGSGLITVREGMNATVTAMYEERPSPLPPQPKETDNSLVLRAKDTDGNPVSGMFATIYDASTGEKVDQGFTELKADHLKPGTYPIFFANFNQLAFVSASPGSWVQTTFGGAGLVTIPDDGSNHNVVVMAVYDRTTTATAEQFHIQAPLDIKGNIFSITSNETRPEGPFVMSGSFALKVSDEDPANATFSAYFMSAREDSNENVQLDLQRSRDHDTFQIVDFKPQIARPVGPDSYLVSGTADLLLNGDRYSNDEKIQIMVRGGEDLTPTNIEIEFRGHEKYSAEHRLETLFGAVTSGFQ